MSKLRENLPKILYDQSQFTALNWIGPSGLYLSEGAYQEMKNISGYAPVGWITYTQNMPESFWFGAYPELTLEKEAEYGLKNFSDPVFLRTFEADVIEAYRKVTLLRDEYFSSFYTKEKAMVESEPKAVEKFLKEIQQTNEFIIARYLLTQPQRFYVFEAELQKEGLNNDLELVSTNGKKLTFITELRKSILDYALFVAEAKETPADRAKLLKVVDRFGFLNWGIFGGVLLDREHMDGEIAELVSDIPKLLAEKKKLDDLVDLIDTRKQLLSSRQGRGYMLADIMGHGAVLRFDLQTLLLCTMKYADNLLGEVRKKYGLTEEEFNSYEFIEHCSLLREGKKITPELILERQAGYLRVYNESSVETYSGEEARRQIADLLEFREQEVQETKELKGTVACFPDKNQESIEGVAFVLTTAFGADEVIKAMKPGEILVATQTHPNLVPKMKEALAIVTDEGGITCHAAIVSRELGKPCIVGTRLASKVIKTGEVVMLNMRTGEVVLR